MQEHAGAGDDQEDSRDLERRPRVIRIPAREPPGNQAGDGARREHQEEKASGCGSELQLRSCALVPIAITGAASGRSQRSTARSCSFRRLMQPIVGPPV